MNAQMLLAGVLLGGLLGCSNPRAETVAVTQPVAPSPTIQPTVAPEFSWLPPSALQGQPRVIVRVERAPLVPPARERKFEGKICQVGGPSCLAMDERPFEACLLSPQGCGEKLRESERRGESFGLPLPGSPP